MPIKPFIAVLACLWVPSIAVAYEVNLTPRFTVSEEYTDNLFLDKDNKEHDFITTLAPELRVDISQKKQRCCHLL